MYKATQAYFKTQLTTTSQGELVVLLYDGAIKFLRRAKEKMEEKDYAEKGVYISKTLDIIQELDSSLDMEKGGDLSKNLRGLYLYAQGRLLKANLKMDQELVEEVIVMLSSLREAFSSIVNNPEAIQAQKQAREQTPININQLKEREMFSENGTLATPSAPATPTSPTSASFRAKAYQQQASTFGATSVAPAEAVEPVKPGVDQPVKQNLETAVPVVTPNEQLAPATPQPQIAEATVTQTDTQPVVAPPAPAQAMTGFARQMINNSLYKKMAVPNQAQATEK